MAFVVIPPDFLEAISADSERAPNRLESDSDRIPKLYYHPMALARSFFWSRLRHIHRMMETLPVEKGLCVDFGCGSGVFLPTLCGIFKEVAGVDLYIEDARKVSDKYHLSNLRLVDGDIFKNPGAMAGADAVVAADTLEHFQDLRPPVDLIRASLKPGGYLFTSLPTENAFTWLTRIFGGYPKPPDHYHTGAEVESYLEGAGFASVHRATVHPLFPLYLVSVWRLA